MKTKTTQTMKRMTGKMMGLTLAIAMAATLNSVGQRAQQQITAVESGTLDYTMKNPGTGLPPVKSTTPAPIVINPNLTGIYMIDKSYDHIVMGWNQAANFDSIMFRVTETGTTNVRDIAISGNPNPGRYFIQGLVGLTAYDIEMRSLSLTGSLSHWSTPITITTFAEPAPRLNTSNNRNSINLFVNPSPATGHTTISFTATPHATYLVSILNIIGTTVFKIPVSTTENKIQLPVDLTGFSTGLYYVRVQSGANSFTKPLIIQ